MLSGVVGVLTEIGGLGVVNDPLALESLELLLREVLHRIRVVLAIVADADERNRLPNTPPQPRACDREPPFPGVLDNPSPIIITAILDRRPISIIVDPLAALLAVDGDLVADLNRKLSREEGVCETCCRAICRRDDSLSKKHRKSLSSVRLVFT